MPVARKVWQPITNFQFASALDLQKRADAAIKNLETERKRLQGTQADLELSAVQRIHDAVEKQSDTIERQTVNALAAPLAQIQQAAGYVRQNVKEVSWLVMGLLFAGGLIVGLMFGYWPLRSNQNNIQEQLNRIEQCQAAQQPAAPAPAASDPHTPGHKGKTK